MIIGIGTDIVQVDRMAIYMKSDQETWKKVFTEAEYEYALGKIHSRQHLAGMWAAKEAAFKAESMLSVETSRNFNPLVYEIKHWSNGAPRLQIGNAAHGYVYHLSISHEKKYAIANVILEKV